MKTSNVILTAGAIAVCLSLTISARADYASTVLADNPMSFWQFNDASSANGATAADSASGGLSPGLYEGGISFVSGPGTGGNGIQLNGGSGGSGSFIDVVDNSYTSPAYRLESATSFSIELWEKSSPQASETYARLISHADGGTGNYMLGMNQNGANAGQPFLNVPGSTSYGWPPNLANGAWNYVVLTYSGATANLYVNGTLEGTFTGSGAFTPPGTYQDLLLGAEGNQYYVYNCFVGDMADVAYYGYALTQSQITAHLDAVPEPASMALLGLGFLASIVALRRRSA
ncbi:MAG: LamG-like jellyroll fold domain-containing protein [Verrucomicrobiota bacterium]|jgi:hypothetical protein